MLTQDGLTRKKADPIEEDIYPLYSRSGYETSSFLSHTLIPHYTRIRQYSSRVLRQGHTIYRYHLPHRQKKDPYLNIFDKRKKKPFHQMVKYRITWSPTSSYMLTHLPVPATSNVNNPRDRSSHPNHAARMEFLALLR